MNTTYVYPNFQAYGFMPFSFDDINRRVAPLIGEEFYRFLNDYLDNNRVEEISQIDLEYFKRLDGFGQTILHWAVVKGDPIVTQFVIQQTGSALFDVKRFYDQCTPLHLAICGANIEVIEILINKAQELLGQVEAKDFIATRDAYGQTALHIAASKGNRRACEILYGIMDGEQVAFQMDKRQQTALHFAVQGNHIDIVDLLLSEPNKTKLLLGVADQYSQTALHWAAGKPRDQGKDIVDLMINRSASLEEARKQFFLAQTSHGYTALHLAVHSESNQTISSLINASQKQGVPELISKIDFYGQTALHWAAGNGNYEACRQLYQAMKPEEISIQMDNQEGGRRETALHFAAQGAHINIIQLLVGKEEGIQAKDANPNLNRDLLAIKNVNNETALVWAQRHLPESDKKQEIIRLLRGDGETG